MARKQFNSSWPQLIGALLIGLIIQQEVALVQGSWLNSATNMLSSAASGTVSMLSPVWLARQTASGINTAGRMSASSSSSMMMMRRGQSAHQHNNGKSKIQGRSSDSDSKKQNSEFQSMCLIQRNPSWTKNPTVHFFPFKNHGPKTYGCNEDIKIRLNVTTIDDDQSGANEEFLEGNDKQNMNIKKDLIDSGYYNATRPTYVLIHGFLASWDSDTWMCKVKDLILNHTEANVMIVDWSGGSQPMLPIDYSASVSNTKYIGELMADFINRLGNLTHQNDASRYHLIGHSLGAHISGYIGYSVGSIGRITALDPAGPCFSILSDSYKATMGAYASHTGYLDTGARRLSPESANLVVALHTDTSLFGMSENCGHYDVYVNGGVKQPECTSFNPADRLSSLLSLDLSGTFDFNLACAHSYAHDLLDSLGSTFGSTFIGPHVHQQDGSQFEVADTCSPVAFRCSSYAAFKAGECGLCSDNSTDCFFTGLDFGTAHISRRFADAALDGQDSRTYRPSANTRDNGTEDNGDDDSDDNFNGEREAERKKDDIRQTPVVGQLLKDPVKGLAPSSASPVDSHGRHFIKSGAGSPTCLYHYQIVVASSQSVDSKRHFYLRLPLDSGNGSSSEPAFTRLVQISHQVKQDSPAYSLFSNEFASDVSDKLSRSSNFRKRRRAIRSADEQLDFYTALITFTPLEANECKHDDKSNGRSSDSGDKWFLCKPLDKLRQAHLWSASKEQLEAVRWVSLNYMSGLTQSIREQQSYLLARTVNGKVIERQQVKQLNRPSVSDLYGSVGGGGLLANPIGNLLKPVDCLVSFADRSDAGKSRSNLKCRRSQSEMKFAIPLEPIGENNH